MKLESRGSDVLKSDLGDQTAFTIKATSKAFSILSSGLYSDKEWAIERELCTNAADGHCEAGKTHVPFEIHLPDHWDSQFWVEDFGTGMPHEDVLHLYTTYFDSTRSSSNKFTGALGLGSKSPFSYTNGFTVASTFEGTERIYSAYLDEEGCPNITLMGVNEVPTKINGVKVSFPVRSEDWHIFRSKLSGVLEFFDNYKIINADNTFEAWRPDYLHVAEDWKWALRDDRLDRKRGDKAKDHPCRIIQGPIAYPLNIKNCVDPVYKVMSSIPMDIFMNMGDVDIAASREELSYTKDTINKILIALTEVKDQVVREFEDLLKDCKTDWEKVLAISKIRFKNAIYSKVYSEFTQDIFKSGFKFEKGEIKINLKSYRFLNIRGCYGGGSTKLQTINVKDRALRINTDNPIIFLFNDLKSGSDKAIKDYLKTTSSYAYIFSPMGLWGWENSVRVILGTMDDAFEEFLDIMNACGNPKFVKLSDVAAPIVKTTSPTRRRITAYKLNLKLLKTRYYNMDKWIQIHEVDSTVPKLYVELQYLKPQRDGYDVRFDHFIDYINDLMSLELIDPATEIYAIPHSGMKKSILKDPNWIPFFEGTKKLVEASFHPLEIHYICLTSVSEHVSDFFFRLSEHTKDMEDGRMKKYLLAIKNLCEPLPKMDVWRSLIRFTNYRFTQSFVLPPKPVKEYPLLGFFIQNHSDYIYNQDGIYKKLVDYINLIEKAKSLVNP